MVSKPGIVANRVNGAINVVHSLYPWTATDLCHPLLEGLLTP